MSASSLLIKESGVVPLGIIYNRCPCVFLSSRAARSASASARRRAKACLQARTDRGGGRQEAVENVCTRTT